MKKTEQEIIQSWKGSIDHPLVSIRCMTYNHNMFIRDAIDGFLMQETDFPFEIFIHDDASTDGTDEILREYEKKYPHIIRVMYEDENQHSKRNTVLFRIMINEKMKGKYIAWCEGDDCWTDSTKLQRQVDFMEANPEYTLCYHPVYYYSDEGKNLGDDSQFRMNCDVPAEMIISKGGLFCASCSLLFKRSDFAEWPKFRSQADIVDYPLQIHLALKGKVKYLSRIMGIYRVAVKGSWSVIISKNKDTLMQHYRNEKKWLKELDRYTKGQYRNEIMWHMVDYVFDTLVPAGACSMMKAWQMWSRLKPGKEKKYLFYRMVTLHLRKLVKRYVPFIREWYKKLLYGQR